MVMEYIHIRFSLVVSHSLKYQQVVQLVSSWCWISIQPLLITCSLYMLVLCTYLRLALAPKPILYDKTMIKLTILLRLIGSLKNVQYFLFSHRWLCVFRYLLQSLNSIFAAEVALLCYFGLKTMQEEQVSCGLHPFLTIVQLFTMVLLQITDQRWLISVFE